VDYPSDREEIEILRATTNKKPSKLTPVLNAKDILSLQEATSEILVADYVIEYASRLVRATRPKQPEAPAFVKNYVEWGAGPRAGQSLIKGAKAFAALDGRPNASCEDIRRVALPVLRHRVGLSFAAETEGIDDITLVRKLLETVKEPERS